MNNLDILSEFLGTMVLIILGNGVGASVSYKKMFANQSGKWIVITMGWGFAVLMGVLISNALGGSGHLNPAVSIYATISKSLVGWKLPVYIVVQILGAMTGQVILNFINYKHLIITESTVIRGTHCTNPAFTNFGADRAVVQNFSYELVGSLILLGIIAAIGRLNFNMTVGPLSVTFLVMAIGMSLGSSTGYAINPARDLGPRAIYHYLEKLFWKKHDKQTIGANWSYSWVPVIAPSIAAVIVGALALI